MSIHQKGKFYRQSTHRFGLIVARVGRDECVHMFDDRPQADVKFLRFKLLFDHRPIELVEEEHGLDPLAERLPKHRLRLRANTYTKLTRFDI